MGYFVSSFNSAYKNLNSQQKQAVDTIDGPVMVIAGPGTGKTQLLSVRAASILEKTDTKANNILCLTFTDAAASEMQERLVKLIGHDGYDINVMTFHAFGTEVMGRWPEFFYNGAHMQAIDETNSYSVLHDIFASLGHSNPLSTQFSDEFTYLKDTQTAIGQLKKAAISPGQLKEIVKDNQEFINKTEPIIVEAFGQDRLSKKTLPRLEEALSKIEKQEVSLDKIPLSTVFYNDLEKALEQGSTPPVSEFKRKWLRKNSKGILELKEKKNAKKLLALASIYEKYQETLQENRWFDYDDMVMQVVQELASNEELRAELQEQYLYLMIDEFQDTNEAQLQLMKLLGDNPVNEGRPNVLVVGDDDQAIYKFQGADITNMHQFIDWVIEPAVIPLRNIYRYPSELLELSKTVISNVSQNVADSIDGVEKNLEAMPKHSFTTSRRQYENEAAELDSVAKEIEEKIKSGADPSSIAVIGRQHSHLEHFSVYAQAHKIPVSYDRRDNILDEPMVKELIHFAKVLIAVSKGDRNKANGLMPELLSYRFWGIKPADLWALNKEVRSNDATWLDIMLESEMFKEVAELILDLAQSASVDPLNYVLDKMIGTPLPGDNEGESSYSSPFYKYFFDRDNPETIDQEYIQLLSNLKTLKFRLKQYSKPGSKLEDLITFVDIQNRAGLKITSSSSIKQADSSVTLLSAHKAKGLEFDTIFILHASDNIWGAGKRGRSSLVKFPGNLNISPAGDSNDDRVRLFYVAITRAKKELYLSSCESLAGRKTLDLRLLEGTLENDKIEMSADTLEQAYILDWTTPHIEEANNDKSLLQPFLENYRLSISHLQNYVDVAQGGPSSWLIFNLLKFPGPVIPPAAYGSAIHATINDAQKYLTKNNKQKLSDKLKSDFVDYLKQMELSETDYTAYAERGTEALEAYLAQRYKTFKTSDKSEVNFYNDNIVVGKAKVTGLIDRLNLEEGSWENGKASISDLKTGKSAGSWTGKSDFEKIKLYRYKQQLMFYEIMFEQSSRFKNVALAKSFLEFVEQDEHGDINTLVLSSSEEEKQRLKLLISGVWNLMHKLELPNIENYPQKLDGIIAFEDEIISSANTKTNEALNQASIF